MSKKSKVSFSWTPINCSQINAERESAVDFTAPFLESGAGDDNSGALVICCQLFNLISFYWDDDGVGSDGVGCW